MMDTLSGYEISAWARELGFSSCGISGVELPGAEKRLASWLMAGFHGEMDYMAKHGAMRARPAELLPGTRSVISVSLAYAPPLDANAPDFARVSCYALGRDYHKVLKKKLEALAARIKKEVGPFNYRVFVDSAPLMEVALAEEAGIGWRGKNTLLLTRRGSWFFLGEILTDLEIAPTDKLKNHCGSCSRCLASCPTGAIVEPYLLDARRCISYLTIELKGSIPLEFRPLIGNRIYGCDDCQSCCPWNRFARDFCPEFSPRNGLEGSDLLTLFSWSEQEFRQRFAGSPILRLGHARWLRNIAVALGNSSLSEEIKSALQKALSHPEELVREHAAWALTRQA